MPRIIRILMLPIIILLAFIASAGDYGEEY